MMRVLLAQELGDGLGHVARLLPIATALRAEGLEPLLALREPVLAAPLLRRAGLAMIQAPFAPGVNNINESGGRVAAFPDLLAIYGWQDRTRLAGLVEAWQGLLDSLRPALVVADFAPILCLAAFGQLPVVCVGSGYTLPPAHGDRFPRFRDLDGWADEKEMLAAAQAVQAARGRPQPAALPRIMAGPAFVTTLPMLDPYHGLRRSPASGPLTALPSPVSETPGSDYFAYLAAGYPGTRTVLETLAATGLTGAVHLRGGTPALSAELRALGLVIHAEPQPMGRAVAGARLVIHHGGLGTSEAVLALGRPQLLVPRHLEHILNAEALCRAGVAVRLKAGGRFTPDHVAAAARALRDRPAFAGAATSRARALAAAGPHRGLEKLVRTCLEAIAGHRAGAATGP